MALFAVFLLLLLCHSGDEWQYLHDDNGAFYSAIARSHLLRGVAGTGGQDFFVERATDELAPYLHHPPLLGLYLAAVFALAGQDTPGIARLALILVHSASFLLFAVILRELFPSNERVRLWALFVFAISPMSVFFGKMPNHEPLSLAFLLLGVLAYLRYMNSEGSRSRSLLLGSAAWILAGFTSWHAIFFVGGIAIHPFVFHKEGARTFGIVTIASATGILLFVAVHILWANDWAPTQNHWNRLAYWSSAPDDSNPLEFFWKCLRRAYKHGRRFYGNVPWMLSVAWIAYAAAQKGLRRNLSDREGLVLCSGVGSATYVLVFPNAVRVHAYQLFYLLPFVAMSSGLALDQIVERVSSWRLWAGRVLAISTIAFTAWYSLTYTIERYASPEEYAVRVSKEISERYY